MTEEHLISLQPGTVIDGRYEVVKCLGAGSMGLVYACRHRELSGHLVAVKVLFPEVSQDKVAAARFRNEIFASYGVSHPNVVRAYEYLRDGDLVAYTMEYVGGGDLAERLGRSREPIPISDVIKLLAQMCAGVQAIHDSGIVHRDLKPENILLTRDGDVKIADFGIARTGHGPKLTEHGGVVGTIDYVSPEYILNSQVDSRSDIYAMGILGYEMLTGESPFRGDSVYATMTKRLKTDPEKPSTHRADCPKELDAIILKAMQRDPDERYQSAGKMQKDLELLASQRGERVASIPASQGETAELEQRLTTVAQAAPAGPAVENRPASPYGNRDLPQRSPELSSAAGADELHPSNVREPPAEATARSVSSSQDVDTETRGKSGGFSRAFAYTGGDLAISSRTTASFGTDVMESLDITRPDYRESGANDSRQRMMTIRRQENAGETTRPGSEETHVLSTAIDADRMKKLHELVDRSQPWDFYDFLRLTVAILCGLMVGLLVINYMLSPDMLSAFDVRRIIEALPGVGR